MPKEGAVEAEMTTCGDSSKVERQTFLFGDNGSNPISPHQFHIRKGEFSEFAELLEKYHYKGSKIGGNILYNLVLVRNNRVYGGVVIGRMRHEKSYNKKAVELRRMVLDPICPKNTASYLLSKTIWWLKKNTDITTIYTFADRTVGHKGICYKAANFTFIRETEPTMHVLWKGKRYHPRSLSIDRPYSYELREAVKTGSAIIEKGQPKNLFRFEIYEKIPYTNIGSN